MADDPVASQKLSEDLMEFVLRGAAPPGDEMPDVRVASLFGFAEALEVSGGPGAIRSALAAKRERFAVAGDSASLLSEVEWDAAGFAAGVRAFRPPTDPELVKLRDELLHDADQLLGEVRARMAAVA